MFIPLVFSQYQGSSDRIQNISQVVTILTYRYQLNVKHEKLLTIPIVILQVVTILNIDGPRSILKSIVHLKVLQGHLFRCTNHSPTLLPAHVRCDGYPDCPGKGKIIPC